MVRYVLLLALIPALVGCKTDESIKGDSEYPFYSQASLKTVVATAAKNEGINGDITGQFSGKVVSFDLPDASTDRSKLILDFTYAGESISLGGVAQTSGQSSLNLSTAQTYQIKAHSGSQVSYSVGFGPEFSSFSFTSAKNSLFGADRIAGFEGHSGKIGVPQGTAKTSLIASFTHNGSKAAIGTTTQTTGVTSNDFSNPLVYKITDPEGRNLDFTITTVDYRKLPDTGQTTSYSATFGEDHDYSIHLPSFTDGANGTVTDNQTGLIWQQVDDNTTYSFENAEVYCSNLSLGSMTNWRLPSILEIYEFINAQTTTPAINSLCSASTNAANYWSSSSSAANVSQGWAVDFDSGNSSLGAKTTKNYARCVSGSSYPGSSYTNNGNSTITDHSTGLTWEQTEGGSKTWEQALSYCEALNLGGKTDWRLPNIKSLRSLVDFSTHSPAINTTYFPKAQSLFYWSSTTYNGITGHAWYVNFSSGEVTHFLDKTTANPVRCVRGGN